MRSEPVLSNLRVVTLTPTAGISSVILDISQSYDPDGEIVGYQILIFDPENPGLRYDVPDIGSVHGLVEGKPAVRVDSTIHEYSRMSLSLTTPGIYLVSVTALDDSDGQSDPENIIVIVNDAPTVEFPSPLYATVGVRMSRFELEAEALAVKNFDLENLPFEVVVDHVASTMVGGGASAPAGVVYRSDDPLSVMFVDLLLSGLTTTRHVFRAVAVDALGGRMEQQIVVYAGMALEVSIERMNTDQGNIDTVTFEPGQNSSAEVFKASVVSPPEIAVVSYS